MRRASIRFLLVFASGLALLALRLFSLNGFAGASALVFAGGAIIAVFALARLIDEATR